MKNEQFPQPTREDAMKIARAERKERILQEFEKPDPNIIRESWKVETIDLHGKPVEIIGVAHHTDTLKVPEFREKLESAIAGASLVVLEGAPTTYKKYPVAAIKALLNSYYPEISDEDSELIYHKVIDDNPAGKFFEELQAIAARHQKDIATVDPNEDIYKGIILNAQNRLSEENKAGMVLASLVALVGLEAARRFMFVVDRYRQVKIVSGENPVISRRTFLKGMLGGMTLAGATAVSSVASFTGLVKDRKENPLGFALYNLTDYRDASVAEAIDRLSREDRGPGPIEVIYGRHHHGGIRHYLESPIERKARLLAYAPFEDSPEDSIKLFSYDGEWKRKK
ncbi:MAG: hypothetical protein Q8Q10_04480 [bacterium]|nr:hypothetical protein [bacterium]